MKLIKEELNRINKKIDEFVDSDFSFLKEILNFSLRNRGKQLRAIIGILSSKLISDTMLNENQIKFLASVELIHNATLIHDDIIDEAQTRRNQETLCKKFNNKLAVLTGDFYLSAALNAIVDLQNFELKKFFANSIKELLEGELSQDLSLFKIPSVEEYKERIRQKTALLFELACFGSCLLSDAANKTSCENLKQFGLNFGIGFQIADDLKNFESYVNKPIQNDYENGVMTLPIILLSKDNEKLKMDIENKKYNFSDIFTLLNKNSCFEETKEIAKSYFNRAADYLSEFENSDYKRELINLCYSNIS